MSRGWADQPASQPAIENLGAAGQGTAGKIVLGRVAKFSKSPWRGSCRATGVHQVPPNGRAARSVAADPIAGQGPLLASRRDQPPCAGADYWPPVTGAKGAYRQAAGHELALKFRLHRKEASEL